MTKPAFGVRLVEQCDRSASGAVYEVARHTPRATLFGQVADSKAITFHKPLKDLVTDVLKIWCASEDIIIESVHLLTKLVGRFPYKLFSLDRYVDYCHTSDTVCWIHAGEYFCKLALLPYTSPLALHGSSRIQNRHCFDLKAPLRHIYSEYDPVNTHVAGPPDRYTKPYASPMFYQTGIEERNRRFLSAYSPSDMRIRAEKAEHPEQMRFTRRIGITSSFRNSLIVQGPGKQDLLAKGVHSIVLFHFHKERNSKLGWTALMAGHARDENDQPVWRGSICSGLREPVPELAWTRIGC